MYFTGFLFFVAASLVIVFPLNAQNKYTVVRDHTANAIIFVFKSDRGDVRFNHDVHKRELKAESCLPCHNTKTPSKDHTMTRFDQRVAHSFCKGCHREIGRGPTECHECHNRK